MRRIEHITINTNLKSHIFNREEAMIISSRFSSPDSKSSTIIRKALAGEPMPIYRDGKNIRDWLYVLDHCKGIDLVYHTGREGETYNIGGRNEQSNLQIVDSICEILDEKYPPQNNSTLKTQHSTLSSYKSLITFVEDRAGHDRRYAIDATKLEGELGWLADEDFDSGILKTVEWYSEKYNKVSI